MAPKFRGSFDQKIDGKGRVSVPASFRKVIEASDPDFAAASKSDTIKGSPASVVVIFGDHRRNYLECRSIRSMDVIDAGIDALLDGSKEREYLEELYYAQSVTLQVDDDGRIILPQRVREKIGLDGETLFVAAGERFEIWKPETYEAVKVAKTRAWLDAKPEDYNPLSEIRRPSEAQ